MMLPGQLEDTPGVILTYQIFVPWASLVDDTSGEAYMRMSNETVRDMFFDAPENLHDRFSLVSGQVIGRNADQTFYPDK